MTRQERKTKGQSDPPAQKQKSSIEYQQIESNNFFFLKKTIHHDEVGLGLSQECRIGSTLENEIKMSRARKKGKHASVIQWGSMQ